MQDCCEVDATKEKQYKASFGFQEEDFVIAGGNSPNVVAYADKANGGREENTIK